MTNGLQFKLSEGSENAARQDRPPQAVAAKLADDETQNLLKRLQPITSDASDEQDFAIRDKSLPPPRTGKTLQTPFPSPTALAPPEVKANNNPNVPLQVLRFAPEGNVPLVPQVSVTFSQPMIAVTSQSDAAQNVPVQLTPQPAGKWRWVGTKTLLFEAADDQRFPAATDYTVTIPAGTKSATGASLGAAKSFRFATPPPQMQAHFPNDGPQRRDPLMFVSFDQRINPEAVLANIKVTSGSTPFKLRLASEAEINSDNTISSLAKYAEKNRWLAFRVVDANGNKAMLPVDSNVNVTVAAGTPSAEGPKKTTAPQAFSFRTYGAFRVTESRCGYNDNCSPFDQWTINFTNPIQAEAFDSAQVKVEPAIEGMKTAVYGNTLVITGIKKGRTTYRVQLSPTIKDQFDQTLGNTAPITFNVKSAPPALASSGSNFIVLDPTATPRFSVYSINYDSLKVRLYKVAPEDWQAFGAFMHDNDNKPAPPPGKLVYANSVVVKAQPDEMAETRIDLAPALDGGFGQIVIVVEPPVKAKNRWENRTIKAWLQATQIGLDAFVDNSDLIGWANSLKDGKPLDDVQLSLPGSTANGITQANGLAKIALPDRSGKNGFGLLVARKGKDVAMLPENIYWWNNDGNWYRKPLTDSLRWFVFDDRKMYKPGEEVHLKGWLRRIGAGKDGDVMALDGEATSISYVLRDSRGNEITKGIMQVNALGGFDAVLKLPGTMNLGYTNLQLEAQGSRGGVEGRTFNHQFQVQEFRRPEFEVSAQASEGPHFVGGGAEVSVTAAYYAGGGLPNADVNWVVRSTPAYYTPPNRYDFTFGKWIPWWRSYNQSDASSAQTFTARTDAAGKHRLHLDFISADPPRPYTITAEASVTDVNRQAWNASSSLLVHPANLYVGIRSPRTFVQKGEPLVVQTIVTDLDGKAIAGRNVKVRAVLLDWVQEKGEWKQKEVNPQERDLKSASEAVETQFESKEGGQYQITATIYDDRERRNESELTLWVAGGKVLPKRDVEQEEVQLIPNQKEYKPGDTAEILVQAPFFPAEAVLTLQRSGIISTERFTMNTASHTLKIPIKDAYTPNLNVQVDVVGAAVRTDDAGKPKETLPKRPAYGVGSLNLTIPPLSRKLTVKATPKDKATEPGKETSIAIEVKDDKGNAVSGSEVALVVVDEAILGLTGYRVGDPLYTFYSQRSADTSAYHLRERVLLARPDDLLSQLQQNGGSNLAGDIAYIVTDSNRMRMPSAASPAPMKAMKAKAPGEKDGGTDTPINVRENFNPLAIFAPTVKTDSDGRATVQVKLPDNLTRYRVMAVAVAGGKQFGMNETNLTARLPLMVRPSAPRFLNFGDKFELPVVLQNQTDFPMDVAVAVRASNAELTDGGGRRVTIPANDRVEVRFPTSAMKAGTARFQIAAASGEWADAAEVSLPVWTPATTEAFATYGELDNGAIIQPIKAPSDAIKQYGGLEVTTSSTQLQELTDAVLYLTAYPYECSEQLSSRIMSIAALKDVLTAFKAKDLPSPDAMVAAVKRDIKRLQGMQNGDGGFGFWKRGDETWPYLSIHVAHALQRAKEKGFDVPDDMLNRSKDYLRNIESKIPSYYGIDSRRALIAYALYVRNRLGDKDAARARRLIAEATLEKLSLEAVGWLLSVLSNEANSRAEVAAMRQHLNNRATEEAATAHFVTSYSDSNYLLLHSDRRADGVILEALIQDQPSNDLIPKVVRGLLAHRTEGRWGNTQENAFVLLALDKYFNTYEKVTPDFIARAWLGQTYAGDTTFKGRSINRFNFNVPMKYLLEQNGAQNLILSKEGAGRLYYRVGMQYAPTSLKLDPADYGFTVERKYEAIDKADDVKRDADGTWRIKAGAKVRVKLTMVAQSRRYHVALVDPIPAGLEALNPALAVTGSIPQDPNGSGAQGGYWWWWRTWYEHQNLRDERVEAFASLLWEGVYNYSYVARATTPGEFVVPPAKAEEMYHPETFGRSGSDRVIVE
ncbi:MAG: Ig-like domain-containing protein [Acidobacteria bacterium]|nr:Ig-like domain-containing protein [Acidobacteriota bacterium]